jgi:hypothetical protein
MQVLNLQFLQEELKRISEWIKFADQKVAFLAVYYSALFGFIVANGDAAIQKLLYLNSCVLLIDLFVILLGIVSFSFGVTLIISAIFPRLNNRLTNKSLFYYGSVSNMRFVDFKKKMTELSEDETKEQIIEQIYTNSVIADQKMKGVKRGTICLLLFAYSIAIYILI